MVKGNIQTEDFGKQTERTGLEIIRLMEEVMIANNSLGNREAE